MANDKVFIHDIPITTFADYFAKKTENDAISANRRYSPMMMPAAATAYRATFKLFDDAGTEVSDSAEVELYMNDPTLSVVNNPEQLADLTKLAPHDGQHIGIKDGIAAIDGQIAYILDYECYLKKAFGGISFYPYFGVIRGSYYYNVTGIRDDAGNLADFRIAKAGPEDSTSESVTALFGGAIDATSMKAITSDATIDIEPEDADNYSRAYYRLMDGDAEIGRIYVLKRYQLQKTKRDIEGESAANGGYYAYRDEYIGKTVYMLEPYDSPFMQYHKYIRDIAKDSALTDVTAVANGESSEYFIEPSTTAEPNNKWVMAYQMTGEHERMTIGAKLPVTVIEPTWTAISDLSTEFKISSGEITTGYKVDPNCRIDETLMRTAMNRLIICETEHAYGTHTVTTHGLLNIKSFLQIFDGVSDITNDDACISALAFMMAMHMTRQPTNEMSGHSRDYLKTASLEAMDVLDSYIPKTADNYAQFVIDILTLAKCSQTFGAAGDLNALWANISTKFYNAIGGKIDLSAGFIKDGGYFDASTLSAYCSAIDWNEAVECTKKRMTPITKIAYSLRSVTGTSTGEDALSAYAGLRMPSISVSEDGVVTSDGIFPSDSNSHTTITDGKIPDDIKEELAAWLISKGFGTGEISVARRDILECFGMASAAFPATNSCATVTIFDSDKAIDLDANANAALAKAMRGKLRRAAIAENWFDIAMTVKTANDVTFARIFNKAVLNSGAATSIDPSNARKADSALKLNLTRKQLAAARASLTSMLTGWIRIDGAYYRFMYIPSLSDVTRSTLKMITLRDWISLMTEYYGSIDRAIDRSNAKIIGVKTLADDGVKSKLTYYVASYSHSIYSTIDSKELNSAIAALSIGNDAQTIGNIRAAFEKANQCKYNGIMGSQRVMSGKMAMTLKTAIIDIISSMFSSCSSKTFTGLIANECEMDAHLYGLEHNIAPLYADDSADNAENASIDCLDMTETVLQRRSLASYAASSDATGSSLLKSGDAEAISEKVANDNPFLKIGRYSYYGTDAEAKSDAISRAESLLAAQKIRSTTVISSGAAKQSKKDADAEYDDAAAGIKSNLIDFLVGYMYHGEGDYFTAEDYRKDYDAHFKDKVGHVVASDPGFEWRMEDGGDDAIKLMFSNASPKEAERAFVAEFRRQRGK